MVKMDNSWLGPYLTYMAPARLHAAFDHPDWLFEPKYDDFRTPAFLISRRRNVYKSFPTPCAGIANAGLIVHIDPHGKPQFYHLLRRRSPQYLLHPAHRTLPL
jgi:hypothetical protein